MQFIFGGDTGTTYEDLQRKRELSKMLALSSARNRPKTAGEGLAAIGRALAYRKIMKDSTALDTKLRGEYETQRDAVLDALLGRGVGDPSAGGGNYEAPVSYGDDVADPRRGTFATGPSTAPDDSVWQRERAGIFNGESQGDYDALFGYANRPGGRFEGVKASDMSLGDLLKFSDPSGEYAQWVKAKIGRVATPMGAYQIVGSTLRDAMKDLNLTPDMKFTPALQEVLGRHIRKTQGLGAWEGYKGHGDPGQYDVASVAELMGNPYATEGDKAIYGQALTKALTPPDPYGEAMKALEFETAQAELDKLKNPPPKQTSAMQDYKHYVEDQIKRGLPYLSFNEWELQRRKAGASTTTVNAGPKLTEGQSKDVGFLRRGTFSNQTLNDPQLAAKGTEWFDAAGESFGAVGRALMQDPGYKRWRRAASEFLAVVLRKDTGAAVTADEFALYGPMYLPVVGDDPATLSDKAQAREQVLKALYDGLGNARAEGDRILAEFAPKQPPTPAPAPAPMPGAAQATPAPAPSASPAAPMPGAAQATPAPQTGYNGQSAAEISRMDPVVVMQMMNSMSDDEWDALPDDVFRAMGDRVRALLPPQGTQP